MMAILNFRIGGATTSTIQPRWSRPESFISGAGWLTMKNADADHHTQGPARANEQRYDEAAAQFTTLCSPPAAAVHQPPRQLDAKTPLRTRP
jgi:hypothetical protein